MDSNPPPDPPGFGPGSPGFGPGGQPPPEGPQSPAPGPQSPAPAGSPSQPLPPYSPPAPTPTPGPETPGAPPAPGYGGPVPPGGWQQPPAAPAHGQVRAPLASWGSRLGAYLIDGMIVFLPASILAGTVLGGVGDDLSWVGAIAAFLGWALVLLIVVLLYAPVLMMRSGAHNGQTWGKQLLGIRAVQDNGEPWTFWPALVREVLLKNLAVWVAFAVIPVLPWFLNFFWPLWDDQNRALHDMAASSHVVQA